MPIENACCALIALKLTLYADPQLTMGVSGCSSEVDPECLDRTNAITHQTGLEDGRNQIAILVVWHPSGSRRFLQAAILAYEPGNQLYDYRSCADRCRQQAGVTTIQEMSACIHDQFQKTVLYPAAALVVPKTNYSLRAEQGCLIKADASLAGKDGTWFLFVFPVLCTR